MLIIYCLAFIFILYNLAFLTSILTKNVTVLNLTWPLGIASIALISFFSSAEFSFTSFMGTLLVLIWGIRQFLHRFKRSKLNIDTTESVTVSWIRVYLEDVLSGILFVFVVCIPLFQINLLHQSDLSNINILGVVLWCIGFLIQSVSDNYCYDLNKKSLKLSTQNLREEEAPIQSTTDPAISQDSLKLSSFTGEFTMWLGIFLMAVDTPNGGYTLVSPLLILLLLVRNKNLKCYNHYVCALFVLLPISLFVL